MNLCIEIFLDIFYYLQKKFTIKIYDLYLLNLDINDNDFDDVILNVSYKEIMK